MFLLLSCSSGWTAAWVCLVDHSLLGVRCPCPLCVLSESGKWRLTASVVSPGQDENCLFLIAFSHVGLVENPADRWRYQTSSSCVFNLLTQCTACTGSGWFNKNLQGGRFNRTVSVLWFRTICTSGICHRLLFLSCHPCRIAPLVAVMIVLLAS